MVRPPPRSTLFPATTPFRSEQHEDSVVGAQREYLRRRAWTTAGERQDHVEGVERLDGDEDDVDHQYRHELRYRDVPEGLQRVLAVNLRRLVEPVRDRLQPRVLQDHAEGRPPPDVGDYDRH